MKEIICKYVEADVIILCNEGIPGIEKAIKTDRYHYRPEQKSDTAVGFPCYV